MTGLAMTKHPVFDFIFDSSASQFTTAQQAYIANHADGKYVCIATSALVFDTADPTTPRILLLQRASSDSMPNRWEVPGGGCDDDDESILYAVARELWEEAGLKARHISGAVGEPHLFSTRSGKRVCKFNFVVQADRDHEGLLEAKLNPVEHQQFVWASEEEVRAKKVKEVELLFTNKELVDTILDAFDRFKKI